MPKPRRGSSTEELFERGRTLLRDSWEVDIAIYRFSEHQLLSVLLLLRVRCS